MENLKENNVETTNNIGLASTRIDVDDTCCPTTIDDNLQDVLNINPLNQPLQLLEAIKSRLLYSKVRDIEDRNVSAKQIEIELNKAIMDRGFNVDEDDLKYLKLTLIKTILSTPRYSVLTLKEIQQAFYKGVRGQLGKYYGISVISIEEWLNTYIKEYSSPALLGYKKAVKKMDTSKDAVLQKESWVNSMDYQFQLFKKDNSKFIDFRQYLFMYLEKHGLVDWESLVAAEDKRLKTEIKTSFTLFQSAEAAIIKEKTLLNNKQKNHQSHNARQRAKAELDNLRERIGTGAYRKDPKLLNKVQAIYRQSAISVYLKQLIESKTELKSILEQ